MNYRVKGFAASPVVVGLVCLAVGIAIGVGGTLWYMNQHKGGLGDGEDIAMSQETSPDAEMIPDTETVSETQTEPSSTEPVTESLSYIKVVVSGKEYFYKGEPFALDGIIAIVRTNPDLSVHISDDGATKDAYDALIGALEAADAEYIFDPT